MRGDGTDIRDMAMMPGSDGYLHIVAYSERVATISNPHPSCIKLAGPNLLVKEEGQEDK